MSGTRRWSAAALLLSLSSPLAAGAQIIPVRPDTTPPRPAPQDTTGRPAVPDTLRRPAAPDTLRRPAAPDTIPGWPYLRRGVVPAVANEVPPGPLAPGSRYTFTRDSVPWTSAQTLSDLLGGVPGVYLARTGFLGLPEYVLYGGRGAVGVRVFWDGMPWEPMGGDSVYVDLSRIPLTYLRRVDVEVLPAELRVYLTSERHETLPPRSVVRVMSGDFRSASYGGLFQQRWASGLGLNLAANFVQSEGASRSTRQAQEFDVWAKGEWLPTATSGVAYQMRRQQYDRDAVPASDGGALQGVPARHGARTDVLFTLFASQRPFDLGLRANAGFGASHWSNDSALGDRHLRQAFLTLGLREPRFALEVVGRLADVRTTSALEARAGWAPLPGIVLAAGGSLQHQQNGLRSRAAHASAALVRGPFSLAGDWAIRDGVQAPALPGDTLQETRDGAVRFGMDTRPLAGHVSLVRRDAYQPLPPGEVGVLSGLTPSRAATYWVADARLQPINALTLDGWFQTPRNGSVAAADFQPPSHGRVQITFRSKFWRTFRSGAFDLKVQVAMETWGAGTAGLGPGGTPLRLEATTYWETFLAFQIVGFTAFWDLRDALNEQGHYIPGLFYPNNAQVFGVRWEFKN